MGALFHIVQRSDRRKRLCILPSGSRVWAVEGELERFFAENRTAALVENTFSGKAASPYHTPRPAYRFLFTGVEAAKLMESETDAMLVVVSRGLLSDFWRSLWSSKSAGDESSTTQ